MRTGSLLVLAACSSPPAPPLTNAPTRPAPVFGKLLDKQSSQVVVIGDTIYVGGSGPVMISHDRGVTFAPWSEDRALCESQLVAAGSTIYAIAARCSETDVQTDPDKLFRSTDRGATWDNLGVTSAILRGVDPRDPRVLYADDPCGREYASCRSDDGGASWHPIIVPASAPPYATQFGTLFVADDGALYYMPPRAQGFELDRSDDRGATWRNVVVSPQLVDVGLGPVLDNAILGWDLGPCRLLRSVGGKPFATAFQPKACEPGSRITGHGRFACGIFGDDQVVASNDGGATWHDLGLPHAGFGSPPTARFTCVAQQDRLLIAALDGLFAIAPPW